MRNFRHKNVLRFKGQSTRHSPNSCENNECNRLAPPHKEVEHQIPNYIQYMPQ